MPSKVPGKDPVGSEPRVALAPFLADCPAVITLGIKPVLDDYSPEEKQLLRRAAKVYFPSWRYLDLFESVAKPTFPSAACYRFQRSLALQQTLFGYLRWPALRARVYYGDRQKSSICADFELPVQVSGLINRGRDPRVVRSRSRLETLSSRLNPVMVRQVLPWQRAIRCIAVNYRIRAIQERVPSGLWVVVEPDDRLQEPISRTLALIESVGLDDIMVNWGLHEGVWICDRLDRPPWKFQGRTGLVNRHHLICDLIRNGAL